MREEKGREWSERTRDRGERIKDGGVRGGKKEEEGVNEEEMERQRRSSVRIILFPSSD